MLNAWVNWKILVSAIVSSMIPIFYILKTKKFSIKKFSIWLLIGVLLFSVLHVSFKDQILWWGFVILLINTLLIFALWAYFIVWILSLGTWISDKILKFKETRWQEMFLNFGMWIWIVVLLVYILASFSILYPILTWIIFLWLGFMIYVQKKKLANYKIILSDIIQEFKNTELKTNRWKWIWLVLMIISIMYYFYGFELSFIPYSTAWDANHAYMYETKILAESFGVMRWNIWIANSAPQLRHAFITFWFSLTQPIKWWFWLSPDNIAVSMNFLSWIFVLFFGLWVVKETLNFFEKKINDMKEWNLIKNISFYSWRIWLLLWLTSWMWAFLVFVDNKTDLWVMAMTLLAILSWIIFINHIKDNKEKWLKLWSETSKYIIISWIFFTFASMSKQTAFLDILLFALLLLGLWFNWIVWVWAGIIAMWFMWVLQPFNAIDFIDPALGKILILIWAVIFIIWIVFVLVKWLKDKKWYIWRFILRVLSFGISLLILKWPTLAYKQILNWDFWIWNFGKWLLMGQVDTIKTKDSILNKLALTEDVQTLEEQNMIDLVSLQDTSVDQCLNINYTEDELKKDLRKAVSSNEDVWRYVWYGRKEITKWKWLSLWYNILRLIYPKNNTCYGLNNDAKILCDNKYDVDNFDVKNLEDIITKLSIDGEAHNLVKSSLDIFYSKWYTKDSEYNPQEFKNEIVPIRQYYQDHSIKTEYSKINIPYRYLVPFNVTFNRSLQNLSSYYTDIWFVWMFMFISIILALIYGFLRYNKNLVSLSVVAIVWRWIRWLIGWGIVWYGIWLIMWSTMVFAVFMKNLRDHSKDENDNIMLRLVIIILWLWISLQFVLNFIRISSQWAGWPFLRYRMNVWQSVEYNDVLQWQEVLKYWYWWKDVFDLQFPHYNKFINLTEDREDSNWVLIAWTYIQYFLKNQRNLKLDWMLSRFWEEASDNDSCKTYHRLKNENMKYFVIDPNIATVVMWEWNQSLFDRFFAKRDPINWTIQDHWALSMMTKMFREWYIKFIYSNNIWAKYAYSIDDSLIRESFGNLSEDEMLFLRAKLAVARFFPDANQLVQFIADVFSQRIIDGQAIWDIADIMWKDLDENKLLDVAKLYIEYQGNIQELEEQMKELSQDEKSVLWQYLWIYNILKSWDQQKYWELLNNLLWQSLGGGSQLIVFELID